MNKDDQNPLSPYAKRLQRGMAKANHKMMYRASRFGYSLVIGRLDGTSYEKDAAELMDELDLPDTPPTPSYR